MLKAVTAVVTYGGNLKQAREAAHLTLEQFATLLHLKRTGPLSTLENSARLPKASTIRKHAAALKCTPADLLAGVVTEYDVLRGSSQPTPAVTPAAPSLTRLERQALKLLAQASDHGQREGLRMLASAVRAWPRPGSSLQSGHTREAGGRKGPGKQRGGAGGST